MALRCMGGGWEEDMGVVCMGVGMEEEGACMGGEEGCMVRPCMEEGWVMEGG